MHSAFSWLDWLIFGGYLLLLALSSYILSDKNIRSSREFFVSSNSMPMFAVAISILATSQSAATFLGVPEFSYKYDFTFLGFYFSAFFAALFISYFLIPKFYEIKAISVYELLEQRYGEGAKQEAGILFLLGRVLASGARLYIASLAVSMILFLDTQFLHIALSVFILICGALAYTYFGGVRSVIFSDVLQAVIYVGAGVLVFVYLYTSLEGVDITAAIETENKMRLFDLSFEGKFSVITLLSGWLLLNIAAFGLDQDMSQRLLSCKDSEQAQKSLVLSIIMTIPVVFLFLSIGTLLYVFYQYHSSASTFSGENITTFMYYILHELPDGLKGFVTVGAIAAALSSTNSVLGAMASVAIEDIYKPKRLKKLPTDEKHFVKAARVAVLGFAIILSLTALFSYYWQHTYSISLVSFALGVMAFAYTGLLGVYFSALFTSRGNAKMIKYSFAGGFLSVLALQPYTFGINIGFAFQIVIGTVISFFIMQIGDQDA